MGITRVADITGLDRIGIPVTMVVRPGSRSLAVSQGKGLSLAAARVSGIMESVETYHAERVDQALRLSSQISLARLGRVANVDRLAKSSERRYHRELRLPWILGRDLLSGEPVWLPFEAVHTDFTVPRPFGGGVFPADTNGLASGNLHIEAVIHALCEVVERDAIALWHQRRADDIEAVGLASVTDGDCVRLFERLHRARVDVRIWNATSDTGVACFHCLLVDRDITEHADPEFGSGCHPDSRVALLRALTEAVQARTTFIAGSRDDLGAGPYTARARAERLAGCRALMARADREIPFEAVPCRDSDTLVQDLRWLLDRLSGVGIEEVLWVDLSLAELAVPVARVIVPGLEGAFEGTSDDYVPGERARAVIRAR